MNIDINAPILVGIDGSAAANRAARWAAQEAASWGRPLVLLSVNNWPVEMRSPWEEGTSWDVEGGRSFAREALARARRTALAAAADLEVRVEVVEGVPAHVMLQRSLDAFLMVVGRRGGGKFSGLLVGSSAAQVATYAGCPVVVVPEVAQPPRPGGPGIVVGVDIDEHGQRAIEFAFEEASRRNLPLTAVRAWNLMSDEPAIRAVFPDPDDLEFEQRRLLGEALAGWATKYPEVDVHHWLVRRHAGRALSAAGQGASMLVVGARGAGGFPGLLLGSVCDTAIRYANCPVAIAR